MPMALRTAYGRCKSVSYFNAAFCRWQHGGTVFDKMIQLTIVGLDGKRHLVRGLEGDSLVNVIHANHDAFGEDVVALSPEGRNTVEAHIMVPNEYLRSLPPPDSNDSSIMEQLTPDQQPNSRLASRIKLSKQHDRAVFALGHIYPWRTL